MALTERRARKPFTQSTEKVPKPEHLRSARTCACEPYQKAYVRTCAHVTEAHPFVHSAPCAAAPVRTPPVARDRWRDVGRGRHQEVCRWSEEFFCRPAATIAQRAPASSWRPPGDGNERPCWRASTEGTKERTISSAKQSHRATNYSKKMLPGAKCTVFVLGASGVSPLLPLSVTRRGRRAPLVARAGTSWRARRPAHDSPQAHHRRRPTACCRGPGAAPAARLTTSLRRN